MKNIFRNLLVLSLFFAVNSCKEALEVQPFGEFAPSNVLTSENGIKAVLYSAYSSFQNPQPTRILINISEVTTDMAFNSGGAENLYLTQYINFNWDPSMAQFQADVWAPAYRSIRDANLVLENVGNSNMSEAKQKLYTAEAKFLRGLSYEYLYSWFGAVPLRTASDQEAQLARASEDEVKAQIEKDLSEAIADLPDPGKEEGFGRATKGAALGVLTKFYLNTKQWQKAADAAKRVTDLNYYQLFADYTKLFRVENEGNKEMILVKPCKNELNFGNWFSAGALPPAFKTSPQIPEYVWTSTMANFATQYRLRTAYVNSFDPADKRLGLIIKTYVNTSGATVNLASTPDNFRSLKYWDNATQGNNSGNDVPVIRYADILLSRAEALNELSGAPTQEALDLVNLVRKRAGLNDLVLANFSTKESLRDHILNERGWEFYSEGKRREDLLRQDKFLSEARKRNVTAVKDVHVRFPIPQAEIDANKACVQTTGY